jgi:hypothetical protein
VHTGFGIAAAGFDSIFGCFHRVSFVLELVSRKSLQIHYFGCQIPHTVHFSRVILSAAAEILNQ